MILHIIVIIIILFYWCCFYIDRSVIKSPACWKEQTFYSTLLHNRWLGAGSPRGSLLKFLWPSVKNA